MQWEEDSHQLIMPGLRLPPLGRERVCLQAAVGWWLERLGLGRLRPEPARG